MCLSKVVGLEFNGFTQCNQIVGKVYGAHSTLSPYHLCIVCHLFCLEKEQRLHLKYKQRGAEFVVRSWFDRHSTRHDRNRSIFVTLDGFRLSL